MTNEQFDKLVALLGNLGSQAYELAVRQAVTESTIGMVASGALLLVLLAMWVAVLKMVMRSDDDDIRFGGGALGTVVFGVVFVILFLYFISEMIHYLNPQWYALELLARMVVK